MYPVPPPRRHRTVLAGVPVITVLVIVTTSLFAIWLNDRCTNQFFSNVFGYPGAQETSRTSLFLGEQRLVFVTHDDIRAVEEWDRLRQAQAYRHAVVSGNMDQLPPQFYTSFTELDDGGTQMDVWTYCP